MNEGGRCLQPVEVKNKVAENTHRAAVRFKHMDGFKLVPQTELEIATAKIESDAYARKIEYERQLKKAEIQLNT